MAALLSMEALDAELSRLLADDDGDAGDGDRTPLASPLPPDGLVAQVAALEQRVVALEALLADSLQTFQELAEQRLERAAMDAAISVRRAIDAVDGVGAVQHI